jgi:hypothetical protein
LIGNERQLWIETELHVIVSYFQTNSCIY